MAETQPQGALLLGSVNADTTEEVFRLAGKHLAGHLRYVPDGEPGERYNWLVFQADVFERHPDIEQVPRPDEGYADVLPSYRLRPGADPATIDLRPLGYAAAAESSYASFRRLRDAGVLPVGMRFQASLPTPAATVSTFVDSTDQPTLEPVYEAALLNELRHIQDAIPTEDLAVQWDLAIEIGMWEVAASIFTPWFSPVREGTLERLSRIAAQVDPDVPLGFHLCYGDFGHEHFVQPQDTGTLTEMANGIFAHVDRPISWIHLPVPADRDDAGYFTPLGGLQLPRNTDLYLGLVHPSDPEGTSRRIAAAGHTVTRFGVATECGMGRTPREEIEGIFALHANAANAW